jgi:intein/homing endonuclease
MAKRARKLTSPVRMMKGDATKITQNEKYIAYYRSHPVQAAKDLLNQKLSWYQRLTLRAIWFKPYSMLIFGRGCGKTRMLAVASVLRALLYPAFKVGVFGPIKKQGDYIFDEIEALYNMSEFFQAAVVKNISRSPERSLVKFVNGSSIVSLPPGDGCLSGDSLITYENGIDNIDRDSKEHIVERKVNVWGNGKFRESDEAYDNGIKPTKRIITKRGYQIEGTLNHKVKVRRNGKIEWCRFDEIKIGDEALIDRSVRWHEGTSNLTELDAYTAGLLVGDGCYTNEYKIGFSTNDEELVDRLNFNVFSKFFVQHPSDPQHYSLNSKEDRTDWLDKFEIESSDLITKNKKFPKPILRAEKVRVAAFIKGLFDTDGHVTIRTAKGGTACEVGFTNTSETLVRQLQYVLLHFGIVSTISVRDRNTKWNIIYELRITGKAVKLFYDKIGFGLKRKQDDLAYAMDKKQRWVEQGNHDEDIYYDSVVELIDSEAHTYDIHVPEEHEYCANGFFSHNTKIRGARCHMICLDEYAQWDESIVNLVIIPFMVIQNSDRMNKLVISSSAYYQYNHMYDRYKYYRKNEIKYPNMYKVLEYDFRDILMAKGHKHEPENFKVAMNVIKQQKELMTEDEFRMEYLGVFPSDADTFFSVRLIDSCTPRGLNDPIEAELDCYIDVVDEKSGKVLRRENNGFDYVMGVDIAKAPGGANFAIVIAKRVKGKLHVVYCNTINGGSYKQMVKMIRECTLRFNIVRIHMDRGGGGEAVKEELAEPWYDEKTKEMYLPILDMDDDDTLGVKGHRYLRMVNFQGSKHSNLFTNLKSEMEHERIVYPIPFRRDRVKEMEKLGKELLQLRTEMIVTQHDSRGTNFHFSVPNKYRMDRVVALTLAVDTSVESRIHDWEDEEPAEELDSGFAI